MSKEAEVKETVKKVQKVSVSYTLQSLAGNITKLEEAGMLTKDQAMMMGKIKDQAVGKYVESKFK